MKVTAKTQNQENANEARKNYVGIEQFSIVAVNPTTEEINAFYERTPKEDEKEVEYVRDKDGVDQLMISLFLKGTQTNRIVKSTFFITDKVRTNKDGSKIQYINSTGESSWTDDIKNLPDFFTHFQDKFKKNLHDKPFRPALDGEADFYTFIKGAMAGVNYRDVETDIRFELKKMLKGNFKELSTYLLDPEFTRTFTALNFVENKLQDDGSTKTFNNVFTKAILPGDMYNKLQYSTNRYYTDYLESIKTGQEEGLVIPNTTLELLTIQDIVGYIPSYASPKFKDEWDGKRWTKFSKEVEGEYGCKGFYKLAPVFEYNEAMDITASNAPISDVDLSY